MQYRVGVGKPIILRGSPLADGLDPSWDNQWTILSERTVGAGGTAGMAVSDVSPCSPGVIALADLQILDRL